VDEQGCVLVYSWRGCWGFVGGSYRLCGCVNREGIAGIAGLRDGSCLKLGLCGYQ